MTSRTTALLKPLRLQRVGLVRWRRVSAFDNRTLSVAPPGPAPRLHPAPTDCAYQAAFRYDGRRGPIPHGLAALPIWLLAATSHAAGHRSKSLQLTAPSLDL